MELEQRLKRRGLDDAEKIKQRLEIAQRELEHAKIEGFHDRTFVNDDLELTYKSLEAYIFGHDDVSDQLTTEGGIDESLEVANRDVDLLDGASSAMEESVMEMDVPALVEGLVTPTQNGEDAMAPIGEAEEPAE